MQLQKHQTQLQNSPFFFITYYDRRSFVLQEESSMLCKNQCHFDSNSVLALTPFSTMQYPFIAWHFHNQMQYQYSIYITFAASTKYNKKRLLTFIQTDVYSKPKKRSGRTTTILETLVRYGKNLSIVMSFFPTYILVGSAPVAKLQNALFAIQKRNIIL